jgi:hypothetical protein
MLALGGALLVPLHDRLWQPFPADHPVEASEVAGEIPAIDGRAPLDYAFSPALSPVIDPPSRAFPSTPPRAPYLDGAASDLKPGGAAHAPRSRSAPNPADVTQQEFDLAAFRMLVRARAALLEGNLSAARMMLNEYRSFAPHNPFAEQYRDLSANLSKRLSSAVP